jgi:hypothetical protein
MVKKALQEVFHILQPNEIFNFDANKARPVINAFKEYVGSPGPTINTTSPQITVAGTGILVS